MEREEPDSKNSGPSMGDEAGEAARKNKSPRVILESVTGSRASLGDDASGPAVDAAVLRLKIAAWQSAFPKYLPARYELGELSDSSGGQQQPTTDYIA